jgi:hypothetical protein
MTNGDRRQNRRILGVGPICTDDEDENPHLLIKDEKYGWHEFFVGVESTWACSGDDSIPIGFNDSTANNPIYNLDDSLFFRGDAWTSGDSSWNVNVGGAGHLSDQALFLNFKDTLYMPFRGTWTTPTPDSHMIALGYTANGYQWSEGIVIMSELLCDNRGDSAPDRALGVCTWEFMSPTIIPDTGGTYEMWTVESNNLASDSTYIVKWEAPQADSAWRWVRGPGALGRCVYTPTVSGREPWHMRVFRRGRDELWALVAEQPIGETGANTYLTVAVSYDDGFTWQSSDTVLAKGSDAWNSSRVYSADGAWVDEGNRSYFELYYSAYGADHGWATAQTELEFVDWDYEWIYLNQPHGFNRALSDSIWLSFPVQSSNGDTTWLLTDSAGDITAGDDDTVNIAGYVPYACTIDSLEVMYQISSTSEIVDGWLKGPDLDAPTNLTDSIYGTFATDLTSTAWDTAQYAITDISASAGDRFSYKYIVNFDTDNNRLRIGWVRMRVRR